MSWEIVAYMAAEYSPSERSLDFPIAVTGDRPERVEGDFASDPHPWCGRRPKADTDRIEMTSTKQPFALCSKLKWIFCEFSRSAGSAGSDFFAQKSKTTKR
jgi:hypothetical protein